MSYKELPNVKIGVTNSVHSRLRDLKKRGDNFNDVVERLLDESGKVEKVDELPFNIVEKLSESLSDVSGKLSGSSKLQPKI